MQLFLSLNRNKLKRQFLVTAGLCLLFIILVLAIAFFTGSFPGTLLFISILAGAGILLPAFVISATYIKWAQRRQVRLRVISRPPFNALSEIGFQEVIVTRDSLWDFNDSLFQGTINGYRLSCDLSGESLNTIEIEAEVEWRKIDKIEYKRLSDLFEQHDIHFRIGAMVKKYPVKNQVITSASGLRNSLEEFVRLLWKEELYSKV